MRLRDPNARTYRQRKIVRLLAYRTPELSRSTWNRNQVGGAAPGSEPTGAKPHSHCELALERPSPTTAATTNRAIDTCPTPCSEVCTMSRDRCERCPELAHCRGHCWKSCVTCGYAQVTGLTAVDLYLPSTTAATTLDSPEKSRGPRRSTTPSGDPPIAATQRHRAASARL